MSEPMASTDMALLHQLQAATQPGAQLPKHVAHGLHEQGLVALGEHSPGEVMLTERGQRRLEQLLALRGSSDDIVP